MRFWRVKGPALCKQGAAYIELAEDDGREAKVCKQFGDRLFARNDFGG